MTRGFFTESTACVCGHAYGDHAHRSPHPCKEAHASRAGHACSCSGFTEPHTETATLGNRSARAHRSRVTPPVGTVHAVRSEPPSAPPR